MRLPIVAANWKMNNTIDNGLKLVNKLIPLVKNAKCEVVVCPPSTALKDIGQAIEGTNIKLGAQNVHYAKSGAYTGEISAEMLKEVGVEYVIIGHSERREFFGETDETVNKRAKFAIENGLNIIVCVGESLQERQSKNTINVLKRQILVGLKDISDFKKVVIAYEPNWAIGTGQPASLEQVTEVITLIRKTIKENFGKENSEVVRIQYGGGLDSKNAKEFFETQDIDGGLIGSASLSGEAFSEIVNKI